MGYKKGNWKVFKDLGDRSRGDRAGGTRRVLFLPGLHAPARPEGFQRPRERSSKSIRGPSARLERGYSALFLRVIGLCDFGQALALLGLSSPFVRQKSTLHSNVLRETGYSGP